MTTGRASSTPRRLTGRSRRKRGTLEFTSEPVIVTQLTGASGRPRLFGMLSVLPRPGAKMVLLLAPNGRMTTTPVRRVLATADGWTLYVQTENSLYSVHPIESGHARQSA